MPGATTPPPPPAPGPEAPAGYQQPAPSAYAGQELASWGSRVGATLLDGLVILAAAIVLLVPGGILTGVTDGGAIGIILLVLGGLAYIVVAFLYASYFMQRQGEGNGQTLGKQWLNIRVVQDTGQPFGWGSALVREVAVKQLLFQWVGSFFLYIPPLLDVLWPLWDDQNRALHDMIVSTHVVKTGT